jgi:hypothetical protein
MARTYVSGIDSCDIQPELQPGENERLLCTQTVRGDEIREPLACYMLETDTSSQLNCALDQQKPNHPIWEASNQHLIS